MTESLHSFIETWIKRISQPRAELGGLSLCPFAKKARWDFYLMSENQVDIKLCKKEVTIFAMLPTMSKSKLEAYVDKLNDLYPKYVFLPDHKDANTKIKGIATGNGKHNLILVQKRKKLQSARKVLNKQNYYKNLTETYKNKLFSY